MTALSGKRKPSVRGLLQQVSTAYSTIENLAKTRPRSFGATQQGKELSDGADAWGKLSGEVSFMDAFAQNAADPTEIKWKEKLEYLGKKTYALKAEVIPMIEQAIPGAKADEAKFLRQCMDAANQLVDALDAFIPAVEEARSNGPRLTR